MYIYIYILGVKYRFLSFFLGGGRGEDRSMLNRRRLLSSAIQTMEYSAGIENNESLTCPEEFSLRTTKRRERFNGTFPRGVILNEKVSLFEYGTTSRFCRLGHTYQTSTTLKRDQRKLFDRLYFYFFSYFIFFSLYFFV